MFVDGWNEWNTVRYGDYGSYKTAFVDLCDEEGSRDFEPSRSYLKDDYYNLLTDFVRKYKGVRPAPLASAPVTIDINSDAAQWDSVAPEFIADGGSYERDNDGGAKDLATDRVLHYTTKVYNAFSRAKVARDGSNYYFYVKTENDIVKGTPGWMNLFINSDRNPATGWNGYDICVNRLGEGVIASFNGTTWESVGTVAISVSGNVLQMAIPKSFFGDIADIEFKWTDGFVTDDYLDFYTEGSVAPLGRFNYLYTEVAQKALTANERAALKNTTIVKAGSNKMIIDGGKVGVYEKDTRVTAFEMNGTVYVPYMTYEDILGYGYAKVEYDAEQDILHMSRHDLSEDLSAITNKEWTYTFVGSLEVRKNGRVGTLSAPVIAANGILYVPLTYVAETFGWQYQNLGGGIYAIGRTGLDASLINSIANAYLN